MISQVAIIIPFYKGKNWLIEAINSVIQQTYKNWTIYVINDGSSEDLSDLSLIFDEIDLIILNQNNSGAAYARNRGISLAKEKYIAFLDSDDLWESTKLEKQLNFFKNNPEYKWCHTKYIRVNEDNSFDLPSHIDFLYGDVLIKSLVRCTIATPAVMIESEILRDRNFRFDQNLNAGEDTIFWLKLLKQYPIGLINEPLVRVRIRGSNAAQNIMAQFEGRMAIYNFIKNENLYGKNISLIKVVYRYVNMIYHLNFKSSFINKLLFFPAWIAFKILYKFL